MSVQRAKTLGVANFSLVNPTYEEFAAGILAIGDTPLLVKPRSESQEKLITTVYGYRNNPKTDFNATSVLMELIALFYKKHLLRDELHTPMQFRVIVTVYKYYGDLLMNSPLMPRTDAFPSGKFTIFDVKHKDLTVETYFRQAAAWLAEKTQEDKLVQVYLHVDEFRSHRPF